VQDDLLAKYRDRDLKVYVIWLTVLRTDARSEWPRNEIVDPRATHYWDEGKVVGAAIAAREELKSWRPVAFDIWAMYAPGTTWSAEAPRPNGSGRTILRTRDQLRQAVAEVAALQTR
jgi:hypothetical protein